MLDENVSPAADQPDSRAVGQPPLPAASRFDWRPSLLLEPVSGYSNMGSIKGKQLRPGNPELGTTSQGLAVL
eukprot:1161481-Pelagomonas_calceolata.AAC.12